MPKRYEDRYGRGSYRRDRDRAHDRGYMERAADEVRSWFGDDDAERRRHADEYRHRSEAEYRRGWEYPNAGTARSDWHREWRDMAPGYQRGDREWAERGRDWSDERSQPWRGSGPAVGPDWNRDREWNRDSDWGRNSTRRSSLSSWSTDDGRAEFGGGYWGRGPKGYQRSDHRIQEDVCDRLTYSDVDAEAIEVTVTNGEVTLSGTVRDRWDKRRAEDIAEAISGVRDVHNHIRVTRDERGFASGGTSASEQPGSVLGVNPTEGSHITSGAPTGNRRP